MKKRRKMRSKKKTETAPAAAPAPAETPAAGRRASPAPKPRTGSRRPGGFFWGLSLGFLATLGVIVSGDLGWNPIAAGWSTAAAREGAGTPDTPEAGSSVILAGRLPEGAHVQVDGRAATTRPDGNGTRVTVPTGASRLEIKGPGGTWWSTSLTAESDTLRPAIGGELVIELAPRGPEGTLFVDDRPAGPAPGAVADLLPGWHLVSIRNGDRVLFETGAMIRPGEVTVLTAPESPAQGKGRFTVRSRVLTDEGFVEISGRPVWIDGVPAGETPLETTLDSGYHSVRVSADGFPDEIRVQALEAGSARYVEAEFGREVPLRITVSAPAAGSAAGPLAIPVRVDTPEENVLASGFLHVVGADRNATVPIPLVASGTDPGLWVAVVPPQVIRDSRELLAYATASDDLGRQGESELFRIPLK